MLVGDALGGKSTCIDILKKSYVDLKKEFYKMEKFDHPYYQNILFTRINPKSISM